MREETTGRLCQLHVRLEERVDQIDKRLWRTRHWLIYIAFISFVGSFLGSYAGRQWSVVEALSSSSIIEQPEREERDSDPARSLISLRGR